MQTSDTWTAPSVDRPREPFIGDERTILEGYLDWHRQTLLWKCAGLTAAQLKIASAEPSGLTLLGLVRHMAEVERWWFRRRAALVDIGDLYCTEESPDGDFDDLADADPAQDFAIFADECELARQAVADLPMDHVFTYERQGETERRGLRWAFVHMIEEYARHNGHADLIRERIDGVTGD